MRINGVVSSAVSCLNVLNHCQTEEPTEIDDDDDTSDDSNTSERRSKRVMSPPRALEQQTVRSPLRMGSPPKNLLSERNLSPLRRGSVQSRRGSLTSFDPLANFKALSHFRKAMAKKHGSLKTVFASSVFLGGFDRKILVRPLFTTTIPPPNPPLPKTALEV